MAKLYLFIGYPGAGKTTTAKLIVEHTGAVHIWADDQRHKMFDHPTHSKEESNQLYDYLNERAGELLSAGKDVVFDTNFNHYADREKLREIAAKNGGEIVIIWLTTPVEIARQRAITPETRNGYEVVMSEERFNSIVSKLEPPRKDEKVIKIDGTKLDPTEVLALLHIA